MDAPASFPKCTETGTTTATMIPDLSMQAAGHRRQCVAFPANDQGHGYACTPSSNMRMAGSAEHAKRGRECHTC